jgi:N-acetylglucosaminyldiphosphoundecaprenol N-acetyl-beta-D-mannosaminyltransferase
LSVRLPAPVLVAGLPVHPVTAAEAVAAVVGAVSVHAAPAPPFRHVALNAAKVLEAETDRELRGIVRRADLVTADGAGVLLLARRQGVSLPGRVTGIDLMVALCGEAASRDWPVFLLGGREGVAAEAASALREALPGLRVVGARHGYFRPERAHDVAREVAEAGARLLFVGMSTPAKERFVDRWAAEAGVAFAMGVGGSFDVIGGRKRRAPAAMRALGLEWAFRWAQEPRRLFPRYGVGGVRFLVRMMRPWSME